MHPFHWSFFRSGLVGSLLLLLLLLSNQAVASLETDLSSTLTPPSLPLAHDDTTTNLPPPPPNRWTASAAVVDEETGRIFWEGGSHSTLTASLAARLEHYANTPALIASLLLWVAVASWIGAAVRTMILPTPSSGVPQDWVTTTGRFALSLALCIPRVPRWFLVTAIVLYLWEAFFSDPHSRFLSHRCGGVLDAVINNSNDDTEGGDKTQSTTNTTPATTIETLLEQWRTETPQIRWTVRSFCYEPRWPPAWWRHLGKTNRIAAADSTATTTTTTSTTTPDDPLSFVSQRKRVLNQASAVFTLPPGGTWVDQTTAGLWTRASPPRLTKAPHWVKVYLHQVVMLSHGATREAYLRQQAALVQTVQPSSPSDDSLYAATEFATHVHLPGVGTQSTFLVPSTALTTTHWSQRFGVTRRAFWICTLLGMSLPYRWWMDRQCDVLGVRVVKQAAIVPKTTSSSSWRWSWPTARTPKTDAQKLKVSKGSPAPLEEKLSAPLVDDLRSQTADSSSSASNVVDAVGEVSPEESDAVDGAVTGETDAGNSTSTNNSTASSAAETTD